MNLKIWVILVEYISEFDKRILWTPCYWFTGELPASCSQTFPKCDLQVDFKGDVSEAEENHERE
jgi:hypothetical protein